MFESSILGIITGMVFFYLMLGLICSVFGEAIAGMLAWRAGTMYKGLKDIFFDPEGDALINKVYQHPLIEGLRRPKWWDSVAKLGSKGAGKPNKISLTQFVCALRDTVDHLPPSDPKTKKVVDAILSGDEQQTEKLWKATEEQLTDRYQAKMLWLIVGLSIVITSIANADSLMLFNALRTDKAIQTGVASAIAKMNADDIPASVEKMNEDLRVLELFGWSANPKDRRALPNSVADWFSKIIGLLITTIVVARTAPYAFDFFRYAVKLVEYKAKLSQPSKPEDR
jgi:hypothetical protein